jgi:hypothetical protein
MVKSLKCWCKSGCKTTKTTKSAKSTKKITKK